MPEDGEAMPRRLYCLTMPPAQLPYEGCSWASAMLSQDLSMNAVLRHIGQAMHEANDLVPPPMHPWHFRQFPEDDCRGDTPFETAIWTSAIFLMSRGKVCEQKRPRTSEPYGTVGKTKASNKTLIIGTELLLLAL